MARRYGNWIYPCLNRVSIALVRQPSIRSNCYIKTLSGSSYKEIRQITRVVRRQQPSSRRYRPAHGWKILHALAISRRARITELPMRDRIIGVDRGVIGSRTKWDPQLARSLSQTHIQ